MARFDFRFQRLLEIRAYRKRRAEELLAVTMREWQESERRAEQSANLAQAALLKMKQPAVYSVWQVGEVQRYAKMLKELWERDLHQTRILKGKTDEARRQLVEAAREHQVLEKLRVKHLEEHVALDEAEQQKLLDDLGSVGYIRSMRGITVRRGEENNHGY